MFGVFEAGQIGLNIGQDLEGGRGIDAVDASHIDCAQLKQIHGKIEAPGIFRFTAPAFWRFLGSRMGSQTGEHAWPAGEVVVRRRVEGIGFRLERIRGLRSGKGLRWPSRSPNPARRRGSGRQRGLLRARRPVVSFHAASAHNFY